MFATTGVGLNFNQKPLTQLDKIIGQALGEMDADGTSKTTTVPMHMAQMREWGVRGGNIQFKAIQDFNNIRKEYIQQLCTNNYLKQRMDSVMNHLVGKGEILWVVYPTKVNKLNDTAYLIDYYVGGKNNPNPDYFIFYTQEDEFEIDCVVIKSEIDIPPTESMTYMNLMGINSNPFKRWKLTFINKEKYISFILTQEPTDLRSTYLFYCALLEGGYVNAPYNIVSTPKIIDNPFAPEFPFTICKNIFENLNTPGIDDFSPLSDLIEEHNSLLLGASDNLTIFSNPTMITSRDADSVVDELERANGQGFSNSWAVQNGFYGQISNKNQPTYKMPKVIGNIKQDERFGYVQQPDTISGDQNLFIRQLRELIHWTLGGVDPLGISASATFGEYKTLFGRIENTAMKKADALFGDKGLGYLFSMIILDEERKCKIAIAKFMVAQYMQGNPMAAQLVQQELSDNTFRNLYFYLTEQLGIDLPGLPPLGQRDCSWRYTKDVFERTTRDQLDASIVYRNSREDGIRQDIALAQLYPNMSDDEIRGSMSGFSPRVVQNAIEGIGGALQLYQQLSQLRSPENPMLSWAQTLNIAAMVEQGVQTLQRELQFDIPDFKEEPNYDEVNAALTQALATLRNQNGSSANLLSNAPIIRSATADG